MKKSLIEGSPLKALLSFVLPIFLGNIFQQFYNMADTIIVGRTLGAAALAGVGSTGTLAFLSFGIIQGMTVGFTVHAARFFGAGDGRGVKRAVASAIMLSAAFTLILTAVSTLCMKKYCFL